MARSSPTIRHDRRALLTGQVLNVSQAQLQSLQNYTQASKGFTISTSYPLPARRFGYGKRVGVTYSYDVSSLVALTDASKNLFSFLAFSGISGPNALNGIITSKVLFRVHKNTLDASLYPHYGSELFLGAEFSGIGGTVRLDQADSRLQTLHSGAEPAQCYRLTFPGIFHVRIRRTGCSAIPAFLYGWRE